MSWRNKTIRRSALKSRYAWLPPVAVVFVFAALLKRCTLLQTYGLQLKDSSAVETCTSVSKVHEDSAAESAGLTAGESLVSTSTHTHILSLMLKNKAA